MATDNNAKSSQCSRRHCLAIGHNNILIRYFFITEYFDSGLAEIRHGKSGGCLLRSHSFRIPAHRLQYALAQRPGEHDRTAAKSTGRWRVGGCNSRVFECGTVSDERAISEACQIVYGLLAISDKASMITLLAYLYTAKLFNDGFWFFVCLSDCCESTNTHMP